MSSIYKSKLFCTYFGMPYINTHVNKSADLRLDYIVSVSLSTLFSEGNVFLLVGLNLKMESPILNIRLKNVSVETYLDVQIGYIGTSIVLNYPYIHLGFGSSAVCSLFYGKSFFCNSIIDANLSCISGDAVCDSTILALRRIRNITTNKVRLYAGDINVLDMCAIRPYAARAL
jgi:hypothetical protein